MNKKLRDVEVPEALIARLKEDAPNKKVPLAEVDYFTLVDEALRMVPLPQKLLNQLSAIPLDEQLDETIRNVKMPREFCSELKQIPDNLCTEQSLQQVPLPENLLTNLKTIPLQKAQVRSAVDVQSTVDDGTQESASTPLLTSSAKRIRFAKLPSWATAVAVAFVLLSVGAFYRGGFFSSDTTRVADSHNLNPHSNTVKNNKPQLNPSEPFVPPPLPNTGKQTLPKTSVASNTNSAGGNGDVTASRNNEKNRHPLIVSKSPEAHEPETMVLESEKIKRLGMPGVVSTPPGIQVVRLPRLRGMAPPSVQQYDILSLARTGMHPFVSPASHPTLRQVVVPVSTSKQSYQESLMALRQGNRPDPQSIHTEEFLSAMPSWGASIDEAPVRLSVGGGPAPWSDGKRSLLRICLAAEPLQNKNSNAPHLIVVVDASMRTPGAECLAMTKQSLQQYVQEMQKKGAFTLIVAGRQAKQLIQRATSKEQLSLQRKIASIQPEAACDLYGGLELALENLRSTALKPNTHIVVITSAEDQFRPSVIASLTDILEEISEADVPCDVLRFGDSLSDLSLTNTIARLGGGKVHHVQDANSLKRAISATVHATPEIAAQSVRMKVVFNPAAVLRYRLLGHESPFAGGMLASRPEGDLLFGESTTALFEIELQPTPRGELANVEVSWRSPTTKKFVVEERTIRADQLAPAFSTATPEVQLATLAAATAELLHASPYLKARYSPADVLALLASSHASLNQLPTLAELQDMLETMEKLGIRAGKSKRTGVSALFGD